MNLLIILGNAAVDYRFRRLLLQDPLGTADKYGFRLTKYEGEMLTTAIKNNEVALEQAFKALEDQLYLNIESKGVTRMRTLAEVVPTVPTPCPRRPCGWSINMPVALQEEEALRA